MSDIHAPTVDQPLRGIRVVENGDDLAVAFCGKYLAGLGAEVHLARGNHLPDQDRWVRAYVDDGKHAAGALPTNPDVILTPNPDDEVSGSAIRVLVTDYGVTGPWAVRPGGELLAQASSGLAYLIGDPDGPPLQLGGHQIDYSAGLMAFTAVMIALTSRSLHPQTPVEDVQVSRLEAAAYIEWKGRVYHQVGNDLTRGELSGPVVIQCKDGHFGFFYRAEDWTKVLTVLDDPRLRLSPYDSHAGRVAHRRDLAALLSELCMGIRAQELYERLQFAGVPAGPVLDVEGLLASAQYRHRDLFIPNLRGGPMAAQPGIPVEFNGLRPQPLGAAS